MSPVERSAESGILKRLKAVRHFSTSASDTVSSVASARNSSRSPRPSIFSSCACSSSAAFAFAFSSSSLACSSTFRSSSLVGSSAFRGTMARTLCAQPSAWSLLMSSHTWRVTIEISLSDPVSFDPCRLSPKLLLLWSMSSHSWFVSSAILLARARSGSSYLFTGSGGFAASFCWI